MSGLPPNPSCEEPSEATEPVVRPQIGRFPLSRIPIRGPIQFGRQVQTGKVLTSEDFGANPALLVMFICNHCPYVKHLKNDIVKLANCYIEKGLGVIAISSNSVATHPEDGPEFMAEEARLFDYPFPYLYDESQEVARAFSAVCTPEFFLFKKDDPESFVLVYHGQFDDSRPGNGVPVTGRDLRTAIDCVLNGLPVPSDQKPCVGCSIKWHPKTAIQ